MLFPFIESTKQKLNIKSEQIGSYFLLTLPNVASCICIYAIEANARKPTNIFPVKRKRSTITMANEKKDAGAVRSNLF